MAVALKKRERVLRGPDDDRRHGGIGFADVFDDAQRRLAVRPHGRPGRYRHAFVDRCAGGKSREGHASDRVLVALLSVKGSAALEAALYPTGHLSAHRKARNLPAGQAENGRGREAPAA